MFEFDVNDFDDFTAEQFLAVYYFTGQQMDALNDEKERLAKFRNDLMMRYHELVEYTESEDDAHE